LGFRDGLDINTKCPGIRDGLDVYGRCPRIRGGLDIYARCPGVGGGPDASRLPPSPPPFAAIMAFRRLMAAICSSVG